MKFVNQVMNELFTIRPGQIDCDIVIPKLNWRSKLSRITPRVAEQMLKNGTNLFTKKTEPYVNLRPNKQADNKLGYQNEGAIDSGNAGAGHKTPEGQPEPETGNTKHKTGYKKKRRANK